MDGLAIPRWRRAGFGVAALALSLTLAACGSSNSNSSSSSSSGTVNTRACSSSQWVGNRNSKVLHSPGSTNLPSVKNQVCFNSESAGASAGYHLSGHSSGTHRTHHKKHKG